MMAKPISTLELHYPMIQFLIIKIIKQSILRSLQVLQPLLMAAIWS